VTPDATLRRLQRKLARRIDEARKLIRGRTAIPDRTQYTRGLIDGLDMARQFMKDAFK
jgi:hypothetical protein